MVVARRTPVVPPPPLTRNPSLRGTQPPPRTAHANHTPGTSMNASSSASVAPLASSSVGDGDHRDLRSVPDLRGSSSLQDNSSPRKTKKTRKRAKTKYQKSNFQAFLDFLTKLLLLAFTIYTFSVCPQDTRPQSPICRGLTEYKRIILDPYVIPPIQAMFAHPSVAPHIERAKPYLHRAVEITAPVLLRTQQEWNLRVVPQWEKRIVPGWNRLIVPQWNKHVVPQWDKYVVPRIQHAQAKAEPFLSSVTQTYEQSIAPRARVAFYNLQRWQRLSEPYILLAVSKTKDGYYAAKPYAVPLARKVGRLLRTFALFLQEQRQTFVDPHVAKIWEKVKELSSGQVMRDTSPALESPLSSATHSILDTLDLETVVSSTHPFTPAEGVTPTPKDTNVADTLQSASASETTGDEPLAAFTEPTFTQEPEPLVSAQRANVFTSVAAVPSHEPEPPTSSFTEDFEDSESSILFSTTAASSSRVLSPTDGPAEFPTPVTSPKISVPAVSATSLPANSRVDDEIDFDAFYAELGLDEPLGKPGTYQEYDATPPSPPTETESERAERLRLKAEEAARKRADIEARQAKWERELDAQIERGISQLQSRLSDLRAGAAAELASSTDIRDSIEELVSEGEKYIKGAEIYLKNLKGENRRPDEKLALWDRVADRVNDKFIERLSATERVVNSWYGIILGKELQEVATVTAAVREVAEKGQLDLGLDYAWLEDVRNDDWQRYHALIGRSERYADEAASIQNGTHLTVVVANPMEPIFADLASEIQDVVIGFETRLRRIKRDGERAFNNHGNGAAQKEEEKGSIVEPYPRVSIPVVPLEERGPVILGRSQGEVLEVLGKVEPAGGAERGLPLAQDMQGEAAIDHTEL